MIITVTLPWWKAQELGKKTCTFTIDTEQSELDGEIASDTIAKGLTLLNESVKLPPYIATKDVPLFIQSVLGAEYGVVYNAKLD
jgi:hypothetical protein